MHCAVESGNNTILRVLLAAGVNPNVIEGCGISLLHLAALGKSILTCKILVDRFALIDDPSFSLRV